MFPGLSSPVDLETSVLDKWEQQKIFEKLQAASSDRKAWVFYEGPPTANGTPHNGHVLTRVLKDVFPRFRTMQGYRVARKAGWDTHGLPVEVEVERLLDVHGKAAIEAYGLEKFNRACVDNVFTYVREWDELTKSIGFWVDLDDPYVTFHRHYVESVWWALSRLFDKGLLYKGHKVVWWWPQGGTTLSAAEVGLGYKTVDDPAVTVRFRDAEDASISYLAWTTTPWTLPSNVALAVNPGVDYAYCDDPDGGQVVVAADLAEAHGLEVNRRVKGADLVGRRYLPLFHFGAPEGGKAFEIVDGHHVTTKSGTGIVHTAPAYGEDDMLVAKTHGLGLLQWVGAEGTFVAGTGALEGVFCKVADKQIIRELKEKGALFKRETYRHEYPFCWRADDDPLIQFARPAWFIRTTSVKDKALENNGAVGWHPDHIKEGRFGDFLRNNVDWALSRERFWGTPLNIWTCGSCEHQVCPPSMEALREMGATGFATDVDEHLQIHRPWIDRVSVPCSKCGGTMERVPEVIDCWFDSGCMPFAQQGFPHQNVEAFRDQFPADFICEAVDQTRGWFYSLLMISTLLFDDDTCREYGLDAVGYPRPYKNCLVLGHVTDRAGRKESKSKGNYTSPFLVMRGTTRLRVLPSDELKRGTVGLKKAQVDALELGKAKVTLSAERDPDEHAIDMKIVAFDVPKKDTVVLHPEDIAALGLSGGEVWFKLPIEPPGADAFRWLFCSASPAWSNTRLSMRAIREGQREFLIRLRNVYSFFSIYANIAEEQGVFSVAARAPRPVAQRSRLDRWISSRLQSTVVEVTQHLEGYRLYEASRALLNFSDELSNWYVRRSRARFWGEGPDLEDALWTLYEVLSTLSHVLAPFVPFHAEGFFEALGCASDTCPSVHLAEWPTADVNLIDSQLEADMALVRQIASLGLASRAASKIKVRQPLASATVVLAHPDRQQAVESMAHLITEELNVRTLNFAKDASTYVDYAVKPNFKALGPRLGKDVKRVAGILATIPPEQVQAALDSGGLEITLDGASLKLTSDEIDVRVQAKGEFEAAGSAEAVVALATTIDEDLKAEGLVRELVNRVQAERKARRLGYTQRIKVWMDGDADMLGHVERWKHVLMRETLTTELSFDVPDDHLALTPVVWDIEGVSLRGWVQA